MAKEMLILGLCLVIITIGTNANGQFSIIHSPNSLEFSGDNATPESLLKEIYSASLGLSVDASSEWNGLYITDPFSTPEAIVQVYVDGVSSLDEMSESFKTKTYPMTVDEYAPDMFNALKHRIYQRSTRGLNLLVNIDLSNFNDLVAYNHVFGDFDNLEVKESPAYQHLKHFEEEDNLFLMELAALNAITEKIKLGSVFADNALDFYNFRFRSLHALADIKGPNSDRAKEAKHLLVKALYELRAAFVEAYSGSVLVTVVCNDVAHTRRLKRDTPNVITQQNDTMKVENCSGDDNITQSDGAFTKDFSAMFNIILWFNVVFVFSLIAIVYAIMDMDPGRDSIIYRMTSTRMKKDN